MYQAIGWRFMITMVFVVLSPTAFGQASDGNSERQTLRGVKALSVTVYDLDYESEEYGLTQNKVQKDLEAKLRTAGIKVLSKEESMKVSGTPRLGLMIGALRAFTAKDTEFFFISTVIKLRQNVYLERMPKNKVSGITTWSNTRFGINFVHNIRSEVDAAIDTFIAAYLSVNPK
jgi:hypothetical protein